ncbi:hypothetical protein Scep_018734 [Stephania cephalantha]|uniref:Uncharacterized protein n=1 Tax=Stephania cephalantha TaxID=152367 RepID=A0AAP0I9M7_9MAGN
MEDMLRDIGGTMVTTEPGSLHAAYERSLAREAYLSTHPDEIIPAPVLAQSDYRPGGDRRRNKHRPFRSKDDRTQSIRSVAPPSHPARTTLVPSVSTRSYASTPQQPAQLGSPQQYQRTEGRGRCGGQGKRYEHCQGHRYDQGHGLRSSQVQGQRIPPSGPHRACLECGQIWHFIST